MPALPAVPSVIRLVLQGTIGEDNDVISRMFFRYETGTPTSAQLDNWCSDVISSWTGDIAGLYRNDYTLTTVSAEDLTSSTAATGIAAGSAAGTRSGTPLGPADCVVQQLKIARRYRGGHPRVYLPAGVEGDTVSGDHQQWGSTFISAWETAWSAFILSVRGNYHTETSAVLDHVNVSYYDGFTNVLYPSGRYHAVPTRRATPVVDPITGYIVNPRIGSQRRRNRQSA